MLRPLRRAAAVALTALPTLAAANTATAPPRTTVVVSATGSVGIGEMSGGSVQIGPSEEQLRRLVAAPAREQSRLLRDLVTAMNRQAAALRTTLAGQGDAAFTEAAVQQFLATLLKKSIAPGQRAEAFAQIARQYLEWEARAKAVPVESEAVGRKLAEAETARAAGRWDTAERRLDEAMSLAADHAREQTERMRDAVRQSAAVTATRAGLAMARLDRARGATLYEAAYAQREAGGDVDLGAAVWLMEAGAERQTLGQLDTARADFERVRRFAEQALIDRPGDSQLMLLHAWSLERRADVQRLEGLHAEALQQHLQSLALRRQVAEGPDGQPKHRRVVARSLGFVADLQAIQRLEAEALASRREAHAILGTLAKQDPSDDLVQSDLASAHAKLGSLLRRRGEYRAALPHLEAPITIARRLAARDPGDARAQDRVATALWGLADLHLARGQPDLALPLLREYLGSVERGIRRDPEDVPQQENLAWAHSKLGAAFAALGRYDEALREQRLAEQVLRRLTAKSPASTRQRHDLALVLMETGDVHDDQRSPAEAMASYRDAMAIFRQLEAIDPGQSQWLQGRAVLHDRMASALQRAKRLDDAAAEAAAALELAREARQRDPQAPARARQVSGALIQWGRIQSLRGQSGEANRSFREALNEAEQLVQGDPDNPALQLHLAGCLGNLGSLQGAGSSAEERRKWLERGQALVEAVDRAGALPPRQARMIQDFREALARLDAPVASPTVQR